MHPALIPPSYTPGSVALLPRGFGQPAGAALPWCQDAAAVQHFMQYAQDVLAAQPVEALGQQTQHIGAQIKVSLQNVKDPSAMRFYTDLHVLLELRVQGLTRQRQDLILLADWVQGVQASQAQLPGTQGRPEPCNLCLHAAHLQRDLQAYSRETHLTQRILSVLSAMVPANPKL